MTFPAATAQQYFYKSVDFSDSVSRRYIHQVESLSAILLKGYLDGELRAYRFAIKSVDVKWKDLEPQDMPPQWDLRLGDYYYIEDRVTFNGKFYEAVHDSHAKLEFAPPNPEFWKEFSILGDPVSTIHSWPTPTDTTSKAELMESLVEYHETHLDQVWITGEDMGWGYYNGGDVFAYKGKYYECQMDHRPSQRGPDVDVDNWRPTKPRVTFHLPMDDGTFIGVYYWKEIITGRMIPQMLALEYPSYNRFFPRGEGLNFFYGDVVDYLASRQQLPLLYQSNLGYVGTPQLMLGPDNSKLLNIVQENMNLALKPSRKNIVDATKYESFLRARDQELSSSVWSIVQDMITNDLLVMARENSDNGPNYVPVVKISWKAMEKILISKFTPLGPQPRSNYLEWIDDYTAAIERDPEPIDSLEAKVREPLAIPVPMSTYFLEDRFALANDNAVMSGSLESLWTALKRAVNTNQMNLRTKDSRLFPADKPFPGVTFKTSVAEWTLEKGFQLEREPEVVLDSAAMINQPIGIRLVYKRQVTAQKSQTMLFLPLKLAVVVFDQKIGDYRSSWFLWEDVIKVPGLPPDTRKLLMAVKEGTLMFDDGEVIYGLMGEK